LKDGLASAVFENAQSKEDDQSDITARLDVRKEPHDG
jgi:hypothetical protein